jgi:hypothetical protein
MSGVPLVGLHIGGRGPGWMKTLKFPMADHTSKTTSLKTTENGLGKRKKNATPSDSFEDDVESDVVIETNDNEQSKANWPHFLVIKSNDDATPATTLSPFIIEKAIQGCIGTAKQVKKLRSGVLLVEVTREAQAISLLNLKSITSMGVSVTPHRTMNSCKGVVRSYDLAHMDADELLQNLKSQNVTEIRNIFVNRNNVKSKTNTMIFTFSQSKPPTSIKAGYLNVKVEQYIPSPLRCFQCQKYGHHKSVCRQAATCVQCGLAEHGSEPCTRPPHCINCNGDHASIDKKCPKWLNEMEILKVKVASDISFPEARRIVSERGVQLPTPGFSFAQAVKKVATISIATQTDIIRCKCQACPLSTLQTTITKTSTAQQTNSEEVVPSTSTPSTSTPNPKNVANQTDKANSVTSPRVSAKAAAIVAANTERLASKQTSASAAKQSKSPNTDISTFRTQPAAAGRGRPRGAGPPNKSWKETGSDPDRVPKGSDPGAAGFNRYLSMSVESMQGTEEEEVDSCPDATRGKTKLKQITPPR